MGLKKKFKAQYEYVLDSMGSEDVENMTNEEKVVNFINSFMAEYNNEFKKKQIPNLSVRVEEYLRGLPESCSVDYELLPITKKGIEWGYLDGLDINASPDWDQKDERVYKFENSWWRLMATRIMELMDYYDLSFPLSAY